MNNINKYIQEKLVINKNVKLREHWKPKDKNELRNALRLRILIDQNADLNNIDVSEITDMSLLFSGLNIYNIDISEWNVSHVTNMGGMFSNCDKFNCDLSKWNVSNVENMKMMFFGCKNFKGKGLENWDINNAINMEYIFGHCDSLKNKPSWYHE